MQRSRDSQLIKQTVINYKQKIPNDSSKKQVQCSAGQCSAVQQGNRLCAMN